MRPAPVRNTNCAAPTCSHAPHFHEGAVSCGHLEERTACRAGLEASGFCKPKARSCGTARARGTSRGDTLTTIGGGLLAPVFTGGALTGNYEAARARAEQAALYYRRTILVALRGISDALVAYDRDRAEAEGNRARVNVAGEYPRLADLRFRSGVISYLEVLDAQRQLFAAQLDLNAAELNQRVDAIQLYRALGGGRSPVAVER
jgi:multidrug efflux system outer membrane protein